VAKDWTQDEVIKDLERVIEKQDKEIERLREALREIAHRTSIVPLTNAELIEVFKNTARAALKEGE